MSRNVLWYLRRAVPLAVLVPAIAAAQQPGSAEEALSAASSTYGPAAPEPACGDGGEGEIVVCAREQEQSQFRIRSDKQAEDDYARETMFQGDPQAPDVAGPGIFRGPATVGGMCIPGLQKCPRPPAISVDFAELPQAPPGSDADRIARGLPPVGNETGAPAQPETALAEPALAEPALTEPAQPEPD
ncbi:hypothetical protein U4960_02900 [Altererythrobacter sp. H2]|uniref:hypothetical protein n=1 Tax=Altererythrobacter sp. H2 TaxID=3108391 RepID=UPI002B4BC3EA|nr:hypothetical protein [Altererythrobacter sp. H2]WRK96298.1 hypothetical protein U4960_02900 [Altererythrobacter sp. H2]